MDLDRGALARIDRRILSGIGQDEHYRMVRVPISGAVWSTWKRYCAVLGVSMGRGVAGLVAHELLTVIDHDSDATSVFNAELDRNLTARAEDIDARERRLKDRERAFRASEQRLRSMARQIRVEQSPLATGPKIGRNERCPCGSDMKYKRCHGR
jgi:hypothetical protein